MDRLRIKLEGKYSYHQLYQSLNKSRQSYFQSKKRDFNKTVVEDKVLTIVRNWRKTHPKMGSRSIYKSLIAADYKLPIGITRFEQLLSSHGLTVKKVRAKFPKTTDSSGVDKSYKNLTNGLIINGINQLIVADITYFYIAGVWYYLFIFKDVYSQRVLSIIPSRNMNAENCITAINEIISLRGAENLRNTIFHTDNGKQFDAKAFKQIIVNQLEMKISRADTSQQNGSAEQINHVAKNMYLYEWEINSYAQLIQASNKFKLVNNTERAIKQLDYKTPIQFEQELIHIPVNKRKNKELYDFNKWK